MSRYLTVELVDAFAAGIYLLFGVIHLDLWRKRRDRASHLWLACASFGAVAEKIRAAFEREERVTASFGVAEQGSLMSREATIAAADEALYRSKAAGRNRVTPA